MTISERDEGAFLDYVIDLARRQEASSDIRQEHDETSRKAPEGAQQEG